MFENIIGNDRIKEFLTTTIDNNTLSHSYLFVGIQGVGKKIFAREFAKMILCLDEKKYCNKCKSCLEFDTNNNPDFLYIEPDGNSLKIDQIRYIQRKIQEKPIVSNKKVYIINDAEKMTIEAQNCLLKTLEEPPEFVTLILIGSNESSFLPTIKSRCMIINFESIKNDRIKNFLIEKGNSENISNTLLDMAGGSIGKAIELKDNQDEYEEIKKMINKIESEDIIAIIKLANPIYKNKESINEILDYINILLLKKAKENYLYTNCIKIVEETKRRLKQNANYDMCIDNMVFNIWEELN